MTSNLPDAVTRTRPEVEGLDPEWSATVLQTVLSDTRSAPPRRRVRRIVTATAAAVVLTGGVAYATGFVPDFVRAGFGDVSTTDITGERFIADFRAPDGRRIGIWFAKNKEGLLCEAIVEDLDGKESGRGSLYSCGYRQEFVANFGWTMGSSDQESTLYLYGERPDRTVTAVHATGQNYDITIPVDPTTGGWAQAVPQFPAEPEDTFRTIATVRFLNADGAVVKTKVLTEQ